MSKHLRGESVWINPCVMLAFASAIARKEHNRAWHLIRANCNTGYNINIRGDDMDAINNIALRQLLTQRRDAVWVGLDVCPRTCL